MKAVVLLFFLFSPLIVNTNAQVTLQPGTPIERELRPGLIDEFIVKLEENSVIQFAVEQRGIDVIVRVRTPSGKSLGEYDSPNGNDGPEHVSFVAAAGGNYHIVVTRFDPADRTTGRYTIKILEVRQATDQELKTLKNMAGVKAKALALLTEVEETIPQIKSARSRIRAQLQTAQLLWDTDEKRASKCLADAIAGMKEMLASVDPNDRLLLQNSPISQLRYDIVQALATRDPDAALNFLHSTSPLLDPTGKSREHLTQESAMELTIADQIVRNDPKRAFEIARQLLKKRYPPNLVGMVSQLRGQNPAMAGELANDIATKLLNEKLVKNMEATHLAINLVRFARAGEERLPMGEGPGPQPPLLPDDKYRDLVQKIFNEALSYSGSNQNYTPDREAAWNMLEALQQMGPLLDTITTGGAAKIEKRIAEFDASATGYFSTRQYPNTVGTNSVEVALEAIGKVQEEHREPLYIQLANREANNGDLARAKQIINDNVTDPHQRRQSLLNLEQQVIYQAINKGKVEEALKNLNAFRNPRERAVQLANIANQIGQGLKRATALTLLEQARGLLSPSLQAEDQDQMNALFELARAFSRYDPKRAFEIIEPLIEQFNEICVAARTLDGFGNEYYDDGELDLQNGNSVANTAARLATILGGMALTNFDRAKAASDKINAPEVRLRVYLEIAQQAIQSAK